MAFISPIATDSSGKPRQTGSMQSLGRDDFLKLLVTKLEYQDPLNPMQDENFVAQLAQFSSLEQMYNISEGIKKSNEWDYLQMQSINNVMASGLIGREVQANYSGVYYDGESNPTISFTSDKSATDLKITITDGEGNKIATLTRDSIPAGATSIEWDGRDNFGNKVDSGAYNIAVEAIDLSGASFKPKMSLVGIVESIFYRDGAAYLSVSGVEIPLGDVAAIGDPGSFGK
ncbi:MAG: flagellar hook capping FlgD N-terminal domain-containing protein [Candidatus Zixiibacteriota bacterium]